MSHDKIGPKERMLREQREARAARAEAAQKELRTLFRAQAGKPAKAPSRAELQEQIAAIKPKPKGAKKGKKR